MDGLVSATLPKLDNVKVCATGVVADDTLDVSVTSVEYTSNLAVPDKLERSLIDVVSFVSDRIVSVNTTPGVMVFTPDSGVVIVFCCTFGNIAV